MSSAAQSDWYRTWETISSFWKNWKPNSIEIAEFERVFKNRNQIWLLEAVRRHWHESSRNQPQINKIAAHFKAIKASHSCRTGHSPAEEIDVDGACSFSDAFDGRTFAEAVAATVVANRRDRGESVTTDDERRIAAHLNVGRLVGGVA